MSDIVTLKHALADRAQTVAEHLLPAGVREGREWCVGSTAGEAGRSLKVVVAGGKVGTWADFASGEAGDLIDLWAAAKRQTLVEALDDVRSYLGLERPQFEKPARQFRRPAPPKCEAPVSAVLDYLTGERKLSEEAISAYRVGEAGRRIIFRSFLPDGSLAFAKYLAIDRLPNGKKDTRPLEADMEPVLFGWPAIADDAREVVITEGEIDALSMWDFGYPALSVPFGGGGGAKQAWIENEFDRLGRFEVIYLALDADKEGDAGAEEIANRLGRHRCRRVRLPRKDANHCLQDGITRVEIAHCIAAAESLDPPELRRAGQFADEVMDLFWPNPDLPQPGYALPFGKLADKLRLRPAEVTIWTGATGAGKSQILSHALVACIDQGARVCIASLEMAPRQLLKRMVKQAGNVDRPTMEYGRAVIDWLDASTWVFAVVGKTGVERLIEVFEYARARHGCCVFVVDSLMRLGVGAEDYEGQERAVYQLVNWTVGNNVHLHLVAHARKSDPRNDGPPDSESVKGTSEIASNAFNVLTIWRNRKLEEELRAATEAANRGDPGSDANLKELDGKPPVILTVAKQRNGDFEGRVGLWFSAETYQYRSAGDNCHGRRYVSGRPLQGDAA